MCIRDRWIQSVDSEWFQSGFRLDSDWIQSADSKCGFRVRIKSVFRLDLERIQSGFRAYSEWIQSGFRMDFYLIQRGPPGSSLYRSWAVSELYKSEVSEWIQSGF